MRTRGIKGQGAPRTTRLASAVATAAMFFMPLASASMLGDYDARNGAVSPSAVQLGMVSSIGAKANWNKLGTPSSLIKYGDYLATGLTGPDAATVARNWVEDNKALFKLSSTDSLRVITDEALPHSDVYVVSFRQEVGSLRMAEDGILNVGVKGSAASGWKIGYVAASTTGDTNLAGTITTFPAQAYVTAAQNIGDSVQLSDIVTTKADGEWTTFTIDGFTEVQRVRMRAFATPNNGVRPVYETVYLKNTNTDPQAYVHYIDAEDGTVWMRKDIVEQAAPTEPQVINGNMPPQDGACVTHPATPWTVDAGEEIGTIAAVVNATVAANDSLINILYDDGNPLNGTDYVIVASQDTGTSPEAVAYSPTTGPVPPGDYKVQVCDYVDGAGWLQPDPANSYQVVVSFTGAGLNDAPGTGYPPKWTVFPANPYYDDGGATPGTDPSTDNRALWCWESYDGAGCDLEVSNAASRAPWDYNVKTNAPNFTTRGNNAVSAEAWASPLTPGGLAQQPFHSDRDYTDEWTNSWNENKCVFPTAAAQNNVDILAAVGNLFAMHNRMHDWSYELGFTEGHWNAQDSNFGNNGPSSVAGQPVLDGDPVIGNAQAGAASGGPSGTYLGRDNANMITLQDGIPPITNMYLWQPIAGAFYAPCADGDYDMAIIGHEYGHMIENRMIGKGDGRSAHHAGAMGESFGDLAGMEILNEYGFVPVDGENRYALGGFATGSKERGIRNYNMGYARVGGFPLAGSSTTGSLIPNEANTKVNPLNFSNMGYDLTGPQVHADGEIWSATNFTIRTYLRNKYNPTHPYADQDLQKACADGLYNPANCPGNRRWIQIVFDAMLLMPTAPSMLDARDAYLAADMMRFDGDNQDEIWLAFAHRGFGENASSDNTIADVVPDFASPNANNTIVQFVAEGADDGMQVSADIYVGHFEARVSPIADTDPGTSGNNLDDLAGFAPGKYEFVARADGYGHFRFEYEFIPTTPGEFQTITVKMPTNYASNGSIVAGSAGTDLAALIDDTEATNWDWTGSLAVNTVKPQVTVDLGGAKSINRVQVSAMLFSQNRFTALREFAVETSTDGIAYTSWINSGADAFPGAAPRPVTPEMLLRNFDGAQRDARFVRIIALNNQCTGNTAFQDPNLDDDPLNVTDCRDTTISSNGPVSIPGDPDQILAPRHTEVHIAELQVFGSEGDVECTTGCDNGTGNLAPIADDESATTPMNTPVTINVLDGDVDPNGDTLTVDSVTPPANGSVSNNNDGTVTYTPNINFVGTDTFTYTVKDPGGLSDTATVTVEVFNPNVNNAPSAGDDSATTSEDSAVIINVLKNDNDPDGDPLTVDSATMPSNGSVGINGDNTVTYTPDTGFIGTDMFDYTISDDQGAEATATVTVTVTEDPEPENECADDTDSDSHDCKVKGSGKLNDGNDSDEDSDSDKFTIEAKQKKANADGTPKVDGKLYLDTDYPTRKVRGTPTAQSIVGSQATVTGHCEYEFENMGKIPCTFEVDVTEPDQFGVTIFNMSGGVLYNYDKQTIIDGDIDVRSDEEYN